MRYGKIAAGVLALAACAVPVQAADGHTLGISAVVLSKSNCRFNTASSTLSLSLDPVSTLAASASTSISFRCAGSSSVAAWALTHNSGLHGTGPSSLRMRHATAPSETIPYALSYSSGGSAPKNVTHTITITATVAAAAFQNALAGAYSDTVSLALLP